MMQTNACTGSHVRTDSWECVWGRYAISLLGKQIQGCKWVVVVAYTAADRFFWGCTDEATQYRRPWAFEGCGQEVTVGQLRMQMLPVQRRLTCCSITTVAVCAWVGLSLEWFWTGIEPPFYVAATLFACRSVLHDMSAGLDRGVRALLCCMKCHRGKGMHWSAAFCAIAPHYWRGLHPGHHKGAVQSTPF